MSELFKIYIHPNLRFPFDFFGTIVKLIASTCLI